MPVLGESVTEIAVALVLLMVVGLVAIAVFGARERDRPATTRRPDSGERSSNDLTNLW